MKAKYPGFCVACGKEHIKRGDEIERDDREGREGWSSVWCATKRRERNAALVLIARLQRVMPTKYGISLTRTYAPGCRLAKCRHEYVERAHELRVLTHWDAAVLCRYWKDCLDDPLDKEAEGV